MRVTESSSIGQSNRLIICGLWVRVPPLGLFMTKSITYEWIVYQKNKIIGKIFSTSEWEASKKAIEKYGKNIWLMKT